MGAKSRKTALVKRRILVDQCRKELGVGSKFARLGRRSPFSLDKRLKPTTISRMRRMLIAKGKCPAA